MIVGLVPALAILGAAIAFIFARHQDDPPTPDIRVSARLWTVTNGGARAFLPHRIGLLLRPFHTTG